MTISILGAANPLSITYGRDLASRCMWDEIEHSRRALWLAEAIDNPEAKANLGIVLGSSVQLAEICDGCRIKGAKYSIDPPSAAATLHFATLGLDELLSANRLLVGTGKALVAANWCWSASCSHRSQAAKPNDQPEKINKPQDIRIVSMPALAIGSVPAVAVSSLPVREAETTIERDAGGDMTGSKQRTVDGGKP